VPKNSHSAEIG